MGFLSDSAYQVPGSSQMGSVPVSGTCGVMTAPLSTEFMCPYDSDNPSGREIADKILLSNLLSNESLGREKGVGKKRELCP